ASVVGSRALGLWISSIAALSESRQHLLDELQATQESLAAAHRAAGVSSERERIARDLHDTIAQNLAGIVMLTQRSRRDLTAGRLDDDRLALIEDSAKDALEESRTLVAAGAAGLASGGLGAALHRLGERFGRETGIVVAVDA
ncbi:histidine kinase, partial [Aeromonas veronii]|uniref:histidine kinase n=1 Tax=Aeromonas veronii TaxID=654 RepID=UPI001F39572C